MCDYVEILREGINGLREGLRTEGGGREIEAKNNERGLGGKGRQNVVFRHYRPFQKAAKIGGSDDARGGSFGAFTGYHPKLLLPVDSGWVVDKTLLNANKGPKPLSCNFLRSFCRETRVKFSLRGT